MTENTSSTTNHNNQNNHATDAYIRIGETLQRTRRDAGLSKSEVTRNLRLAGSIIDDIEQGRVDRLPALYRRGYIANYARFLELEPSDLLSEVEFDQPPDLQQVMPVKEQGWKFERYLRIATYILVTTVIIPPLIYFFIQGGSRIMERDPVVEADTVVASGENGPATEQPHDPVAGTAEKSDSGHETGETGHVSASALPLAAIRPIRDSRLESEPAEDDLLLPASQLLDAAGTAEALFSELTIEVEEDSWVEIHGADGSRLEYDLLRAGQTKTYQGEAPFEMLLGRANAVRLHLDGEVVTYDGDDRSDVARFELLASGEVQR